MPVHAIDPSTPVRCAIFAATAVRVCYLLSHCFEMMFVWSDRLHQVRHDCHCQGLAVLRVQQRRCKLTNKSQQRLVLLSASSFLFLLFLLLCSSLPFSLVVLPALLFRSSSTGVPLSCAAAAAAATWSVHSRSVLAHMHCFFWVCSLALSLSTHQHTCFVCKKAGIDDKDVFRCRKPYCGNYYHRKCMPRAYTQIGESTSAMTSKVQLWQCPVHRCSQCHKSQSGKVHAYRRGCGLCVWPLRYKSVSRVW